MMNYKEDLKMQIESVEVIPMNKETIFGDYEESFEVYGITTDVHKWLKKQYSDGLSNSTIADGFEDYTITKEIIEFAKKQKIFMMGPTAKLGYDVYEPRSFAVESLEEVKLEGPLINIAKIKVPDHSKELIPVSYLDVGPSGDLEYKKGQGYPKKESYKIRYGVRVK